MTEVWTTLITPHQRRFRKARAELLQRAIPEIEGADIVDVGGSLPFWKDVGHILKPRSVRIFNISRHQTTMYQSHEEDWLTIELYDGKHLPIADKAADCVICNSVIEHVPLDHREGLAREIRRIARSYVIQTPSRQFPIELHFGLPFVHWLPRRLGRQIVRISPFNLFSKANGTKYFDQTRLLGTAELKAHFPDATIFTERFLGIPKSNLAIARA